jgi:hypothetical protein
MYYDKGVLLPVEQLVDAKSYIGNFVLEDRNHLQGGQMVRTARLFDPLNPHDDADLVPPLFNAEVVGADDNQMVVRGYVLRTNRLAPNTSLAQQCWALRLCPIG